MVHNDYAAPSGEESSAEKLARLLADHGHEISWFRRSSNEVSESTTGWVKAFFTGIHNPFAARALERTLDEVKPEIVQVQNIYPLLSPSIFTPIKARRIPIVMRCPNYRLFCPNGLHLRRGTVCERCLGFGREAWCILRNCEGSFCKSTGYAVRNAWARISGGILRHVDIFIVQTAFQKQRFIERGIDVSRVAIVPSFVQYDGFSPQTDGTLVAYVGRVSAEKGIEDFLAAARLMPHVGFAIAGNDKGTSGIRRISPANVQWRGFLGAAQLHDFYSTSRLVVVPSRCYESFPNSLVEAMAHARAVVASRIGALPSIVDDGRTGLLFRPGDVQDLVAKLTLLCTNPQLCRDLGTAGRKRALAAYSCETVYAALVSTYHRAIQHSRWQDNV